MQRRIKLRERYICKTNKKSATRILIFISVKNQSQKNDI